MYLSKERIVKLPELYRANLVNCISGFKSANLIATISKFGNTNVAVFSSVVHLGANPPLLGFVLRPTAVPRNTYKNIKETGFYTINHIYENIIEDAHHTSAKYPEIISEFDKTNLEPEYKTGFLPPFIKDAPVQIGLKYVEEYDIKANNTLFVIGEIQHVYIHDNLLEDDGFVNLKNGNVVAINGLYGYASIKNTTKLTYQRPKNNG